MLNVVSAKALGWTKPPIRFGWASPTHTAIEAASIESLLRGKNLPDLASFLQSAAPVIHAQSDLEDMNKDFASRHYINLDDLDPTEEHVISETIRLYESLVGQFREFNTPQSPEKAIYLAQTIGSLAHYVGDLHMPLHTSKTYTWKTKYSWQNPFFNDGQGGPTRSVLRDIHAYIEFKIMNLQRSAESFEDSIGLPGFVQGEKLKTYLLAIANASFAQIESIKTTDQRARKNLASRKRARKRRTQYFNRLIQTLTPMMQADLRSASQVLATLIYSAYVEAGKPALPELNTSDVSLNA